ncbi:MAG: saccharopine dehydrogenase, partial [Haloferula sp.]
VKDGDKTVWHHSYLIDETGNERGSAMARLVSLPVSLAVESILEGELPAGVLAASDDPQRIHEWLDALRSFGEVIQHTEHPVHAVAGS